MLIFIDQLSQGKLSPETDQFPDVSHYVGAFDAVLQEGDLDDDSLGSVVLPHGQQILDTLQDRPEDDLGVGGQLVCDLLA